jgi:hypothetical protein
MKKNRHHQTGRGIVPRSHLDDTDEGREEGEVPQWSTNLLILWKTQHIIAGLWQLPLIIHPQWRWTNTAIYNDNGIRHPSNERPAPTSQTTAGDDNGWNKWSLSYYRIRKYHGFEGEAYGEGRQLLRATANHKAAVRTLSRDTHCIYLCRLPSIPQPSD